MVEIRVVDAVGCGSGSVCAVVVDVIRSISSFSFRTEADNKTEEQNVKVKHFGGDQVV